MHPGDGKTADGEPWLHHRRDVTLHQHPWDYQTLKAQRRPSLILYYIYRCQSDQPPLSPNMAPVNLVWLEDTRAFLRQFLGKVMRIQCDDDRIFVGLFKCTDKVCTCILSLIHMLTWGSNVT